MVMTHQEAIAIFDHLLTVVLDVPLATTHPIRICFVDNLVESMDDFNCLEPDDMDALSYTKPLMMAPRKQYSFLWVIVVTSNIFSDTPNWSPISTKPPTMHTRLSRIGRL